MLSKKTVLEEESYLALMGEIIERDFFPILYENRGKNINNERNSYETKATRLSLNQYLQKFTSEDNLNFLELLKVEKRKKISGFISGEGKKDFHNALFFGPNLAIKRGKSVMPAISYHNTRLSMSSITSLNSQVLVQNKYKNDQKMQFVSTPSPHPGSECTPILTWGNIQNTPKGLGENNELPTTPITSQRASRELALKVYKKGKLIHRARDLKFHSVLQAFSPNIQKFIKRKLSLS